ncbi:MAG: hypothetical protein U9Q78_09055 [Chloroflexota bacterium]|nr:hypothetical protein [Chloroflexota bacterium]
MEEILEKISRWASRGTLAQFQTEIEGYLRDEGCGSDLQGDELLIYREHKEGGFLGIGGKTIREPVMRISESDGKIRVLSEPLDEEFARYLSNCLRPH